MEKEVSLFFVSSALPTEKHFACFFPVPTSHNWPKSKGPEIQELAYVLTADEEIRRREDSGGG